MGNNNRWAREGGVHEEIIVENMAKYSYITALNEQIAAMAKEMHVISVNQAEKFDRQQYTVNDKVHPNQAGAEKIACVWFEALKKFIF
jgi:lysophospholipase L1-like esterase